MPPYCKRHQRWYDTVHGYGEAICRDCEAERNAPKPLTFTLTITLGNAEMQTGTDIAAILASVQEEIAEYGDSFGSPCKLRDVNGNTVGEWHVS